MIAAKVIARLHVCLEVRRLSLIVKSTPPKLPFARRLWRNWIKPIGLLVLVLGSVRSAVADWNDVPTGSMKPTILEGDRIFVNKLAYDLKVPFTTWRLSQWGKPKRGDVVVFLEPTSGTRMVKRVVGLPGDRVALEGNRLLINGEAAHYIAADMTVFDQATQNDRIGYALRTEQLGDRSHPVMVAARPLARQWFGERTVPAGMYFLMGDNRDNSRDSRVFGFVPRSCILGEATAVALSFDIAHGYQPRWKRFFTAIP